MVNVFVMAIFIDDMADISTIDHIVLIFSFCGFEYETVEFTNYVMAKGKACLLLMHTETDCIIK